MKKVKKISTSNGSFSMTSAIWANRLGDLKGLMTCVDVVLLVYRV